MPTFASSWASLVLLASTALARPQPAAIGSTGLETSFPLYHQRRAATNATVDTIPSSNITLSPIPSGNKSITAVTPRSNITLPYGNGNTTTSSSSSSNSRLASESTPLTNAVVNITLTTTYDGVLLETIENLVSVVCSRDSVSMTFNDTDTLDAAYSIWSSYDEVLLVTNHVGLCDTEFERGFFVSSGFEAFASNLTLVAGAVKRNLSDVATYMRANFSGIPGVAPVPAASASQKRDIIVDPSAVVIDAAFDFGPLTLFSYEDYVSVTANTAAVDVAVTLAGYLDFDIWTLSVEALSVDVETAASAALALALNVSTSDAYNHTFSYDVGYESYLLDVAGILTLGPEIALSVGAALELAARVDVRLDLGAELANGTLHWDLLGADKTAAAGWDDATSYANLTLSEHGSVGVTPFVSVTVGLELEVLGGLVDLSSGLTPRISFPTTVTLDAEQEVDVGSGTNGTVVVTQPGSDGTCTNGVEVKSDFEFTLAAFVTEYWSDTLYSYSAAIADQCYSWV